MVINEHIEGVLRYNVGEEAEDFNFDKSHIVNNSCSISAACCDSGKFTIGEARPSKLTIKLHIPSDKITRYSLFGSSIDISIQYNGGSSIYMGRFYTTSVQGGRDNIYTITACDSLVLMQPTSYDNQNYGGSVDNPNQDPVGDESSLVQTLKSGGTPITTKMQDIVNSINKILRAVGTDEIVFHHDISIVNNNIDGINWVMYRGSNSYQRTTYIDFVKYIAQMTAGCVQMMPDIDGKQEPKLYITPYGHEKLLSDNSVHPAFEPLEIGYDIQERNGTEIADYTVYIQNIYAKTYDGTGWATFTEYKKHSGNVVIDISGNPFLDGSHYHDTGSENPFVISGGIWQQLHRCAIRPYTVKAHINPQNRNGIPHLGRKVKIQRKDGTYAESIITAWSWTLHGGWKLSCGGEDSRALIQGIAKSKSYHAEISAMMYTDAKAATTSGAVEDAKKEAAAAQAAAEKAGENATFAKDDASSAHEAIRYNNANWGAIANAFNELGVQVDLNWME